MNIISTQGNNSVSQIENHCSTPVSQKTGFLGALRHIFQSCFSYFFPNKQPETNINHSVSHLLATDWQYESFSPRSANKMQTHNELSAEKSASILDIIMKKTKGEVESNNYLSNKSVTTDWEYVPFSANATNKAFSKDELSADKSSKILNFIMNKAKNEEYAGKMNQLSAINPISKEENIEKISARFSKLIDLAMSSNKFASTQGILRISSNSNDQKAYIEKISSPNFLNSDQNTMPDVHTLAFAIKKTIQDYAQQLPENQHDLILEKLMPLLIKISHNEQETLMSPKNISIIIAPQFLTNDNMLNKGINGFEKAINKAIYIQQKIEQAMTQQY
ncbi:RhoGAP domain-containing protein [Providencia sneebia]|uniref:Rho-GAP domain-containing protein n=1 Tax=Providencia sneebia DSM 19967 TaxID=1141660 RepID=K8WA00_9GAMM|nr:RhoGAP domain-containing protein [Providencia sneebia]EKT57359.1 hypothetical protein OO7_08220 [Providencia sneebia DSM 19967]